MEELFQESIVLYQTILNKDVPKKYLDKIPEKHKKSKIFKDILSSYNKEFVKLPTKEAHEIIKIFNLNICSKVFNLCPLIEYLTNEIVLILNNYSFSENFKKLYACVFPKGLIEIFCYKEISYFDKFLLDDFKPLNEFGSFNEKCFLSFASFVKDFIKSKHGDFLLICDKIPIDDLNNNIFKISVECEKVTYFTLSGSNDFKNQDIIKVFNFVMVKAIVREIIAHDGFIKKGDKNEKI